MFESLPRLSPGFLSTSWPKSRNILNPKPSLCDTTNSSSSPKSQSEVTPSPPMSPRSLSKSPQSPVLSLKPSNPHSQSLQRKTSKSKSKELPFSLLSPKSAKSPKKTARKRLYQAATTEMAVSDQTRSPLPPKEPRSLPRPPSRVSSKHLREEHPASQQTGIYKTIILTAFWDVCCNGCWLEVDLVLP